VFRRPVQGAACAILTTLVAASPAVALSPSGVRRGLAAQSRYLSATSGAYVRDLTTGRTLYSRRATTTRSPASNEKLLTTTAALLRLGPGARLRTTLRAAAAPVDGVIGGDVALVGAGDPYLSTSQLRMLVSQLAALGVTEITGRVLGDGTFFDNRRGSYDSGYAYDRDIGGSLGGLTLDEGVGSDPAAHAASALRRALLAADIVVGKGAHAGSLPAPGTVVASTLSAPLSTLIARINVPSDNFAAETLLKTLGATFGGAGTTPAGAAVVRRTLAPLGVHARVVDGSGLSRADHVSPRTLVTLLSSLALRPEGPALRASLPIAGRTGTLEHRMRHSAAAGRCQAKTGTLNGVSALSGFCTAAGGDTVAFSFVENGMSAYSAKQVEDRMTVLLARLS